MTTMTTMTTATPARSPRTAAAVAVARALATRASLALALGATLFAPAVAQAQASVTGFRPAFAAEGDPVLIEGASFAANTVFAIGGTTATALRSTADRALVRVAPGTPIGAQPVTADGAAAPTSLEVLPAGSPIVLHVSATTVTSGLPLRLAGHRLGGPNATAELVDGGGARTAARARLGRRVGAVEIPQVAPGTYTLVITNGLGLESGASSPTLTVVAAATPAITAIAPPDQTPLQRVSISGNDLRPPGLCVVVWTPQAGGPTLRFPGRSNGHDRIDTLVPPNAIPGVAYDVEVVLPSPSGPVTLGPLAYTTGAFAAPVVTAVRPAQGPAGSRFFIEGTDLLHVGGRPQVALVGGAAPVAGAVLAAQPGFGQRPDHLLVQTPRTTADGVYGVQVTVGAQASNTNVTYTIATAPLTVTAMRPDSQGLQGPSQPVILEGTGFGPPGLNAPRLEVTWTEQTAGSPARPGLVVFRSDTRLAVIPPGGRRSPLAAGTYTVAVTVGAQSAQAPVPYTVQ